MHPESVREFIRSTAGVLTDAQIALRLTLLLGGRFTKYSVRHIRQNLKIKKARGRGHCEVVARDGVPVDE